MSFDEQLDSHCACCRQWEERWAAERRPSESAAVSKHEIEAAIIGLIHNRQTRQAIERGHAVLAALSAAPEAKFITEHAGRVPGFGDISLDPDAPAPSRESEVDEALAWNHPDHNEMECSRLDKMREVLAAALRRVQGELTEAKEAWRWFTRKGC